MTQEGSDSKSSEGPGSPGQSHGGASPLKLPIAGQTVCACLSPPWGDVRGRSLSCGPFIY